MCIRDRYTTVFKMQIYIYRPNDIQLTPHTYILYSSRKYSYDFAILIIYILAVLSVMALHTSPFSHAFSQTKKRKGLRFIKPISIHVRLYNCITVILLYNSFAQETPTSTCERMVCVCVCVCVLSLIHIYVVNVLLINILA